MGPKTQAVPQWQPGEDILIMDEKTFQCMHLTNLLPATVLNPPLLLAIVT